ncbi:MAG: sn-glycerol-3-phosphate ABC transporter ATP-binding protein UgpC [Hyphomicrobiales bacterium]|nr:MAG: sn-glycerol-3-phosphate ABC transporter ATP-binding protein UgpC [Hyphomicrobiales bacterium]
MAALDLGEAVEPVLAISNLEKRFGNVEVLKSINLDMAPGDFLVLVGPSGCGKSTLLNCIAGLDEVSGGRIMIGGRDVTKIPPRDRDIAMVFQSYALYPTMTVGENIAFGMKVRNVPKAEQEQRISQVANLLQIDKFLARKPSALSGGQRQRVAMGRALVREPTLFLFDEPLSNLDAKLRVELRGEIKRLHERLDASIVYVTHDQIEAMTLGTRVVVLNQGVIQQIGAPEEIYERPANLFVADFMGSPPMNLIPGVLEFNGSGARLTFNGGQHIDIPNPPAGLAAYNGKDVTFGIRPETLTLGTALTGPIHLIENSGSDTFASFKIGDRNIIARFPGRVKVDASKDLSVDVDLSHASYFETATGLRIN